MPHTTASQTIAATPAGALSFLNERLAAMHPGYFALTMATGIVSIACNLLELELAARALLWINLPAYGVLWVALLARIVRHPARILADLASHQRGPGFFTMVAGTSVIGVQLTTLLDNPALGAVLWWVALALWGCITCAVFVLLSVKEQKPSLAEGINGGWLLAVVAPQSVCVLGCVAGPQRLMDPEIALYVLTSLWLCGGMLYIWMISLIFYRYMFFKFAPSDLMPPYWINMGAVAISTLAGAKLAQAGVNSQLLAPLLPFIKGLALMYWATATWWIPILVILGIWRHRVRGFGFKYDPLYWGLVFPLGMYSVCTLQIAGVLQAPFLVGIAQAFVVAALIAWTLVMSGLAGRMVYVLVLAARPPVAATRITEALTDSKIGGLS